MEGISENLRNMKETKAIINLYQHFHNKQSVNNECQSLLEKNPHCLEIAKKLLFSNPESLYKYININNL